MVAIRELMGYSFDWIITGLDKILVITGLTYFLLVCEYRSIIHWM